MKYLVRIGMPVLILFVAFAAAWLMFVNRPVADQKPAEAPTLLVNSFIVTPQDIPISVSISGTVEPHTETTLVAEVSGRILQVSPQFLNGGFFREGEVVLRIDPRNHQAELKKAEAALVRARTNLAQEQSLAEYERGDFEKLKSLDSEALTTSDLTFRKAQLAQAIAEVVAAEAQLIRAQGDVDRTEIRMPYDGLVREKRADLGQFVNPGAPLAVTFAVDYAEVRLPLSPSQVKELPLPRQSGADRDYVPVTITSVDSSHTWRAELVRTEGVLDPQSRTLYAIARVQDPYQLLQADSQQLRDQPLRIGTYVDVTIPGRILKNVIMVERHMLKPGNRIWVIDENMRIQPKTVQLAYADAHHAYISQGLGPGERLCVTPIDNPLPGTPVRIVENDVAAES